MHAREREQEVRKGFLAVFAAKEAGTVIAVTSQQQGEQLIISVDRITPPNEETANAYGPQIRSLLVQQMDSDLAGAFASQLGGAIDVTTNMNAYASYKARNARQ